MDAQGGGKGRQAELGDGRRRSDPPYRPVHPEDGARRAAAAVERRPRRHELRRPAPRASLLRRAALEADPVLPAASCGQAGADGWGAGQIRLRLGARGRDGEAAVRPLLHQAPVGLLRSHDRVRHGEGRAVPQGGGMNGDGFVSQDDRPVRTIFRNVATRYLSVAAEMVVGLITLPFNLAHLGTEAYGLWMLTAGVTIHFSILDLGYGGAMVKFIAQYRAHRNARALNEIASTLFFLFAAFGVLAYLVVIGLAFNLEHVFRISHAQAEVGKRILLIIGVNVAINFPLSVYDVVRSRLRRYDIYHMVAIVSNL